MKNGELEIFLHSAGKPPSVVTVSVDERLVDLLLRTNVIATATEEVFAFVGEGDDSLRDGGDEDDELEDAHEVVKIERKLKDLHVKPHDHVHCYHCRRIMVTVHHGSKEKKRKFSPAATIQTVTQWARRKFKLTDAAADELMLQICDTKIMPRADQRLGELKEAANCAICFNLVPEVTEQGRP